MWEARVVVPGAMQGFFRAAVLTDLLRRTLAAWSFSPSLEAGESAMGFV